MEQLNFNKEKLIQFLFRKSSTKDEKELLDWLNSDKEKLQQFDRILKAKAAYEQSQDTSAIANDLEQVKSRIRRKKQQRWSWSIAASIVAITLATFVLQLMSPKDELIWISAHTKKGEQQELVLNDGSKVILAPSSTLTYPSEFNSTTREIKLNGQAYFDVEHDSQRPFRVITPFTDIEVLGTQFNLKAYETENTTTTSLVAGKVNLVFKDSNQRSVGSKVLLPSFKCSFNHKTLKHKTSLMDVTHEMAWKEKHLSFRNETFREIANKLERHYNVSIVFTNAQLTQKKITGSFDDTPIEEVLETLKEWTDFNFDIVNERIIIRD